MYANNWGRCRQCARRNNTWMFVLLIVNVDAIGLRCMSSQSLNSNRMRRNCMHGKCNALCTWPVALVHASPKENRSEFIDVATAQNFFDAKLTMQSWIIHKMHYLHSLRQMPNNGKKNTIHTHTSVHTQIDVKHFKIFARQLHEIPNRTLSCSLSSAVDAWLLLMHA